jgi:nicotinamide mononucleotide (NMN) deamidase PncC
MFIGLATPTGVEARRVQLPGDRERVRHFATNTALDVLRRELVKTAQPAATRSAP